MIHKNSWHIYRNEGKLGLTTYLRWLLWQHFLLGLETMCNIWALCLISASWSKQWKIYHHCLQWMCRLQWQTNESICKSVSALKSVGNDPVTNGISWKHVSVAKPTDGCDCTSAKSPPLLWASAPGEGGIQANHCRPRDYNMHYAEHTSKHARTHAPRHSGEKYKGWEVVI